MDNGDQYDWWKVLQNFLRVSWQNWKETKDFQNIFIKRIELHFIERGLKKWKKSFTQAGHKSATGVHRYLFTTWTKKHEYLIKN